MENIEGFQGERYEDVIKAIQRWQRSSPKDGKFKKITSTTHTVTHWQGQITSGTLHFITVTYEMGPVAEHK